MKKVLKNIICLIIVSFIYISGVDATAIKINDSSASANEQNKSVVLSIDDMSAYTKLELNVSVVGSNAEIQSVKPLQSGNNFDGSGGTHIIFENQSGLVSGEVATIYYKTYEGLSADFEISPANAILYTADGNQAVVTINVTNGKIKFQAAKSNDASLTSLTVSQGTLTPAFSKDVTSYDVVVSDKINTIKITGEAASGASKTGTGNKTLEMGKNTFNVVVTAEDGTTTKTYTINVNRGEEEKPSAYLKKLSINNIGVVLSPSFDKTVNKYTVDVTPDITKLDFKYEPEDKAATVEIEGNKDFKEGKNKVVIKVTSSDGTETQEYKITVNVSEKEKKVEKKVEKKKKKLSIWVIIAIVLGVLAIIGGVAFIIFKKKKNKNNPKKKDKNKKGNGEEEETTEEELPSESTQNEELFQLEKTSTFDSNIFKDPSDEDEDDDLEKTKEFNF